MTSLLSCVDIAVSRGSRVVLSDISIAIEPSDIVALIGPNGAGKSSLLGALSGLLRVSAGKIFYGEMEVTRFSAEERARLNIAHITEERAIFTGLTVRENLLIGGWQQRETDMAQVFDLVPGLSELLDAYAGELSGDEQQLCAFGRALMGSPAVLLIDELSLGLSPLAADNLMRLLPDIAAQGTAIVVVEQDIERALSLVDRAYLLNSGKLIRTGTPFELLADADFIADYMWGS